MNLSGKVSAAKKSETSKKEASTPIYRAEIFIFDPP
jgi:hypothetical protein